MIAGELADVDKLVVTIGVVVAALLILSWVVLRKGGKITARIGQVQTTMESVSHAVNHTDPGDEPLVAKVSHLADALPEMRESVEGLRQGHRVLAQGQEEIRATLQSHIDDEQGRLDRFERAVGQLGGYVTTLGENVREMLEYMTHPRGGPPP